MPELGKLFELKENSVPIAPTLAYREFGMGADSMGFKEKRELGSVGGDFIVEEIH